MYSRSFKPESKLSFFIFGPRGTRKNSWLKSQYASAHYFDLYGPKGLHAIEVKQGSRFRSEDVRSLELFGEDYPMAKQVFAYGGERHFQHGKIEVVPIEAFLKGLPKWIS